MKEKNKKSLTRNRGILLAVWLIAFLMCNLNLFYEADASLGDKLYQKRQVLDGTVVLVNIDSAALNDIGNLPWKRNVYAQVVEKLNEDTEAKPAAIGLDVVYAGYSDEANDSSLVEACAAGGNVVVACDAIFDNDIVESGGNFHVDTVVQAWDGPFSELEEVVRTGHINAVYDNDGVIRHLMQYVDIPYEFGEIRYQSFARELYEQYCESLGIEAKEQPERKADLPYIRYSGMPGDFSESISVSDILSGEVTGDYFKDKIVLVGPYDATLQDNYKTAISHDENMFGVEIQANMVQAYLNDEWPEEVNGGYIKALLCIIGIALALLLPKFGIGVTVAGWVIFAPGWILVCKLLSNQGIIINPLYVPLLVSLIAIADIALHYITAAVEKRRVTKVFSKYVAPGVVKELLKEDESALGLGGKNVDIAVLFVDIRGFTTMSEAMEPEQVVAILNDYLQLTTDCVMQNEGTLDKFVGDCTMAFWNAPLKQDDYVYKACKAAMDMVQGAVALTDELEKKFGRRVGFGVGVHCGPAVVGNIGAKERMDFTAIGDTVNTASRLESNAPAQTVYISRAVADILGNRAKTTSLGDSVRLKGKAEGFEVLILDELI
ncbi:MAG: CHASE2 domain-containing protein [Anaerovoracaceae bacterium]